MSSYDNQAQPQTPAASAVQFLDAEGKSHGGFMPFPATQTQPGQPVYYGMPAPQGHAYQQVPMQQAQFPAGFVPVMQPQMGQHQQQQQQPVFVTVPMQQQQPGFVPVMQPQMGQPMPGQPIYPGLQQAGYYQPQMFMQYPQFGPMGANVIVVQQAQAKKEGVLSRLNKRFKPKPQALAHGRTAPQFALTAPAGQVGEEGTKSTKLGPSLLKRWNSRFLSNRPAPNPGMLALTDGSDAGPGGAAQGQQAVPSLFSRWNSSFKSNLVQEAPGSPRGISRSATVGAPGGAAQAKSAKPSFLTRLNSAFKKELPQPQSELVFGNVIQGMVVEDPQAEMAARESGLCAIPEEQAQKEEVPEAVPKEKVFIQRSETSVKPSDVARRGQWRVVQS